MSIDPFKQFARFNGPIISTLNKGIQQDAYNRKLLEESKANSTSQHEYTIQFSTYKSPTHGITIQYPSNWEKIEADDNIHFLSPLESDFDPYREGVSIYVLPSQGLSLDACVDMQINNLKQTLPTFLQTESKPTTLAGNRAHEVRYLRQIEDVWCEVQAIFSVINDKLYIVQYHGKDFVNYLPIAKKMISTLNITAAISEKTDTGVEIQKYATDKDGFLLYKNSSYGITIQYPSNWEKIEVNRGYDQMGFNLVVGFNSPRENMSDIYSENVTIGFWNLPYQAMSLSDFVNLQIGISRQSFPGFKLIESSKITIQPGNYAHRLVFQCIQGQIEIMVIALFLPMGNQVCMIMFATEPAKYSLYLPVVTRMIYSFKFND